MSLPLIIINFLSCDKVSVIDTQLRRATEDMLDSECRLFLNYDTDNGNTEISNIDKELTD